MSISQAKLKGNLGAIADYFLEVDADLGDYYLAEDGEPEAAPPRGLGTLAERLGLTGEVTAEQLLRLLDGRHPITGRRLLEYRKDRVAGVDQTASAPKSVSVVWAVGAPGERQAVERSQDTAVTALVEYMQRHCRLVRDHGEPQLAKDVLAVAVNHHTSRQTEEQATRGTAPDPQLHTHLLWLLAERQDGRLCAIYRDEIWKNRIEWEAAYHCALATELARAGFPIQRMTGKGGRYFEIRGIPETLRKRWSGRSVEVTEAMEVAAEKFRTTYGREATPVELRREVVKSRRRKLLAQKTDLRHYWRSVADELHGITPDALALLRRSGGLPSEAEAREIVASELLGPDGLTKEHADFSGRDLRVAALRHGAGLLEVAQVEQLILDLQRSGELRLTGEDRWTTRRMWEMEQRVLHWHEERRNVDVADPLYRDLPTQEQLFRTVIRTARGDEVRLSVEQLEVLGEMLGTRATSVTGWAGTGKGVVATAAGMIWRSQRRRIVSLAVAGKKAADLAVELGEGTEHMSIEQFLHRHRAGRLQVGAQDVLVIDEAGQVSTEQWDELRAVIGMHGRLVMLGDTAQLGSIGAGGLWPLLSRGAPKLREVHRTRLPWERDAWSALRHGRSTEAFAGYAEHDRLLLSSTRAESLERAVRHWARDGRTGLLITDASNAERDWLNRAAQEHRRLAGELSAEEVTVRRPHGDLTLHRGDRVPVRRRVPPAHRPPDRERHRGDRPVRRPGTWDPDRRDRRAQPAPGRAACRRRTARAPLRRPRVQGTGRDG
jgi:conjugative relaxase-like TrwC/TraI family protein